VSAAAGSGKTRVLVERLMRHVAEGADIDGFLVITYTRAAAAELRSRIQTELSRLCAEDPENRRLRRQVLLSSRAQIGTIHSFCAALLRENAHLLALAPDFRVADEDGPGRSRPSSWRSFWTRLTRTWTDPGSSRSWTPWARGGTTPPWRRFCRRSTGF
jgi:ATP-dependent exoDNAse (exonuclease V) beta subunit